jgi:hypothetical protein
MIGGLIVTGSAPRKVLVRAIAPSLEVEGKLLDPALELYDRNGVLLQSNDNWRSDQEAEIIATTIPPPDEAESAIVRTLTPAPYTAVLRGVNDTTGVALVEVYALD